MKLIILIAMLLGPLGCDFIYSNPLDPEVEVPESEDAQKPHDTDDHLPLDTDTDSVPPACYEACAEYEECLLGRCVQVLATDQDGPSSLALDTTNVFWTTEGTRDALFNYNEDGAVWTVPNDGGAIVELAAGQRFPSEIFVDDTHVYWATAEVDHWSPSGIRRVAKEGGAVEEIITGITHEDSSGLVYAVGADQICWATSRSGALDPVVGPSSQLECIPRDLSTAPVVVYQLSQEVTALTIDGADLYWATSNAYNAPADGASNDIVRAPIDGSTAPEVLASDEFNAEFYDLMVDESYVYWAEVTDMGEYILHRASNQPDPGSKKNLTTLSWNSIGHTALDGTLIYWSTGDDRPGESNTIYKTPTEPGETLEVLSGPDAPHDIALDAFNLFGITSDSVLRFDDK